MIFYIERIWVLKNTDDFGSVKSKLFNFFLLHVKTIHYAITFFIAYFILVFVSMLQVVKVLYYKNCFFLNE